MARKKSKKRKVGATARKRSGKTNMLMFAAGAAGGYFLLAKPVNDALDKAIGDKVDSKIVAGGEIALGALVAFKMGKKSTVKTIAGGVAVGIGLKRGMTAFGIGGFQSVPAVNGYRNDGVNGYQNVKAVNGSGRRRQMGSYNGRTYTNRMAVNNSGLMDSGSAMMQ